MLLVLFNKFKVCYLCTYYITPLSIKIKSYYLTFYTAYTANNKMQRNWTCDVSPTGREHQVHVKAISCRFKSCYLHKKKALWVCFFLQKYVWIGTMKSIVKNKVVERLVTHLQDNPVACLQNNLQAGSGDSFYDFMVCCSNSVYCYHNNILVARAKQYKKRSPNELRKSIAILYMVYYGILFS